MTDIPQAALVARQSYVDGAPVRTIMATTGLNLDQFYRALDGLPQPDGSTLLPPIPRRRTIVRRSSRAATRVVLVTRMMRATEVQVHEIEQRLGTKAAKPTSRERDARAMAVLARTMRDLIALDELNQARLPANERDQSNDDSVPLDIEDASPITFTKDGCAYCRATGRASWPGRQLTKT